MASVAQHLSLAILAGCLSILSRHFMFYLRDQGEGSYSPKVQLM